MKTFLKGLTIGGTMLVPGVSGGSIAMILGIYNQLISSVSSFNKKKLENFLFLLTFVISCGIGMILFAKPLLTLIETYPKPMLFGILGAVSGGLPMLYKEANVKSFSFIQLIYIIVGILIVLGISILPTSAMNTYHNLSLFYGIYLFTAGFILAIALVLPGISVSYLLLLLGLYEPTMTAISELDLGFILPLAIGVFIGIISVTKTLEKLMKEYSTPTYLTILGFVLGSMLSAFPGTPVGLEWIICFITASLGFASIYSLNKYT